MEEDTNTEIHFTNYCEALNFLKEHPLFRESGFFPCLDVDATKVNPETGEIDDDEKKNTATHTWLECGIWQSCEQYASKVPEDAREDFKKHNPIGGPVHDHDLDCGAPTFEEAIVKLAHLFLENYGASSL